MLGYIVLLSVLSTCVGAANICCAPDKWFAHKFTAGLLMKTIEGVNVPISDDGNSEEYFDSVSERSVTVGNYSLDDTAGESKTISDHKANRRYKIDLKKKTCTVETFTDPFEKFCVTDQFTKVYEYVLGFGSNTLSSTAYKAEKSGVVEVVQVSKECIPVQAYTVGKDENYFLETVGYTTFGSDFEDSVFDVPDYCPKCSEATEKHETLSFQEIPLPWRRFVKL
ncbi:uncharacterized protein LOC124264375 [Haliotis rubra]|uniref:uncharacterized protein LOC124264375 n=1 Tax=Haliotis rubra TaxID=36100 RepID=UPI001EE601F2|nr:uncharacterized protein LOC124264375 [Haliotis rubra]